jgi:hypothetical protein
MARKWIAGATKNAHGQFAAKAKKAGVSTAAYAEKEKGAPGKLGKEARLAQTLMRESKHKDSAKKLYDGAGAKK